MEKTLIFEKLESFTESAKKSLSNIMLDHDFEAEIRLKISELWRVDPIDLYLITRIEHDELVVCCASGSGIIEACIYIVAAAKIQKLKSIRFHTHKKAMIRLIKKHFPIEIVEVRNNIETVLRLSLYGKQ